MTKKFFKGAAMLALLGMVGKIIGMLYRLPLTNILGAEGMGLYQMIFPVYSLILAVICGGIPAAISKNVSESLAYGRKEEARQILRCGIITVTALAAVISLFAFIFRNDIANLQGNEKAGLTYIAIIPAIVFSGMIACFRGYFQGKQNLLPSGISQIAEQTVKVIAGLLIAFVLLRRGVEYAVFGAALGISISEAIALCYLALRYVVSAKKDNKTIILGRQVDIAQQSLIPFMTEAAADVLSNDHKKSSFFTITKRIYSVAIPISLGALVLPVSQVVDSFLIVNLLVNSGMGVETATSLYGLLSGPVGSLLNMPSVITVALAAALLPSVASLSSKGQQINEVLDKNMSIFFATVLPCVIVFAIAPEPILHILYSRGLSQSELAVASLILRIESVNIFTLGMIQLISAMLQGVGKAKLPVLNLLLGAVIKVAANIVLLPVLGIIGAAVSNVAFYAVTCSLDFICAKKYCGGFISHKKTVKIILCVLVFSAIFMLYPIVATFMNAIVALISVAVIALSAYILLLLKTKCILLREILS